MRIRNAKEIGALVRDYRIKLGLSQAELARRVGVSRQWVVLLEKGKSTAQLGLVFRTLGVLGITVRVDKTRPQADSGPIGLDKILKERGGLA